MSKQKARVPWHWLLLLWPVLGGLWLLVVDSGLQQALRNNLFDQYQRWHPRPYTPAPVRIVDIDDASLARLGQWPWPRSRIAELIERLSAGGAAAIAFDVMFAEPDRTSPQAVADLWGLTGALGQQVRSLPDHDALLASRIEVSDAILGFAVERNPSSAMSESTVIPQKARFVYVGEPQPRWLHTFTGAIGSLPALDAAAKGAGALTFVPDRDGVVRRVPLVLQIGTTPVATLASEALRVAQGTQNILLKGAGHDSGLQEIRIGALTIPTTPQGEVWVHYTRPVADRYLPAWQLFSGQVPRERLEGHIVLVGSSAQGLMDLRFNPFGLMPGVEAHAQALEQMLTEYSLTRPSWARGAESLALMLAGLGIGFLALRYRALPAAAACTLVLAALIGGSWYAFIRHGWLLDAATPVLSTLFTSLVCSLAHHFVSEREQRWIQQAFARYVSPNRVAHLVDNPDAMSLGGRRQQCSFIFTDLAGFTSLMEQIDPADAVDLLNIYLDAMIAIAFRHDGTLDRIVGDAVAVMFSAPVPQPDHPARALACAIEMDGFASQFARQHQEKGIAFGQTRIGVHAGEVIVGNFGGSNIFDYRALGDTVNTAARLESVNKHLGTRMCVSQPIADSSPQTPMRPVGRLVLKGKTQPLTVFEPISPDLASAHAPLAEYVAAYALLEQGAAAAQARFADLAAAYPNDPLVALHLRRLNQGEQGGVIVMSEK